MTLALAALSDPFGSQVGSKIVGSRNTRVTASTDRSLDKEEMVARLMELDEERES